MAQAQAGDKQLTVQQKKAVDMRNFISTKQAAFQDLLPKHLTPERMVRGFLAASSRTPRLLDCDPLSVLNAIIIASSLGLEVGKIRGGAHIVPFRNKKTGKTEAVVIPDYRGLIDLAYRSGQVTSIEARPVYENDLFDFQYGTDGFIRHKPSLDEPGALRCVYAVAKMRHGDPQFIVMSIPEVEKYRARSPGKGSADSPWNDPEIGYVAMALKTAIRRLTNTLPQAPDLLAKAVEYEGRIEAGKDVKDMFEGMVIETTGEEVGDGENAANENTGKSSTSTAENALRKTKRAQDSPAEQAQPAQPPADPPPEQAPAGAAGAADPAMALIKRLEEAYGVSTENGQKEWEAVRLGAVYSNELSPIQQNEVFDANAAMEKGEWK